MLYIHFDQQQPNSIDHSDDNAKDICNDIELFDNYETFLAHYLEHDLTSQEEQDIGEALVLDFHERMFFIVKMDNVLLDEGDHLDNNTLQGMTRGVSRGTLASYWTCD